MLRPLIPTFGFVAGFVPVATTKYSASSSLKPVLFSTRR